MEVYDGIFFKNRYLNVTIMIIMFAAQATSGLNLSRHSVFVIGNISYITEPSAYNIIIVCITVVKTFPGILNNVIPL